MNKRRSKNESEKAEKVSCELDKCTGCGRKSNKFFEEPEPKNLPVMLTNSPFINPKFEVGDTVFSLNYGNGIVEDIYSGEFCLVVEVKFEKGYCIEYDYLGKDLSPGSIHRTLFQGHDLYYEITEKIKPEKKKCPFSNVYLDMEGEPFCRGVFETEEKALREKPRKGEVFIKTIQLKPKSNIIEIRKIFFNKPEDDV